jgi:hypothetical protein
MVNKPLENRLMTDHERQLIERWRVERNAPKLEVKQLSRMWHRLAPYDPIEGSNCLCTYAHRLAFLDGLMERIDPYIQRDEELKALNDGTTT